MLLGDVVESSVLDTEAAFANLLWHDDDGAWTCTMAGLYDLQFQHLVDLIIIDLPFE